MWCVYGGVSWVCLFCLKSSVVICNSLISYPLISVIHLLLYYFTVIRPLFYGVLFKCPKNEIHLFFILLVIGSILFFLLSLEARLHFIDISYLNLFRQVSIISAFSKGICRPIIWAICCSDFICSGLKEQDHQHILSS